MSKSGEWNDVLPCRKVNGTTSKAQSTAPLPSTPNAYRALHSANLDNSSNSEVTQATTDNDDGKVQLNSQQKKELQRLKRLNIRMKKLALTADETKFCDQAMNQASDEHTDPDKADDNNIHQVSVNKREQKKPAAPSIRQGTEARRAIVRLKGWGDVLLTGPFDLTHPDVL